MSSRPQADCAGTVVGPAGGHDSGEGAAIVGQCGGEAGGRWRRGWAGIARRVGRLAARRIRPPPGSSFRCLDFVCLGNDVDARPARTAIESVAVVDPKQWLLDELAILHGAIVPIAGYETT